MTLEEMRDRKRELGYTNEQIAQMSGLPLGTVQKVMCGITQAPRYRTVQALEKVLHPHRNETTNGQTTPVNLQRQRAAFELGRALAESIEAAGENGVVFASTVDVYLDSDSMVRPDVFVVCDESKIKETAVYGAPELIIEIVTEETRYQNMHLKYDRYCKASVREYWIVDLKEQKIGVYDLEKDTLPQVYDFGMEVPIGIFSGRCGVIFPTVRYPLGTNSTSG